MYLQDKTWFIESYIILAQTLCVYLLIYPYWEEFLEKGWFVDRERES
jgi:hypothetical protein